VSVLGGRGDGVDERRGRGARRTAEERMKGQEWTAAGRGSRSQGAGALGVRRDRAIVAPDLPPSHVHLRHRHLNPAASLHSPTISSHPATIRHSPLAICVRHS
jgi:hypothetical protein